MTSNEQFSQAFFYIAFVQSLISHEYSVPIRYNDEKYIEKNQIPVCRWIHGYYTKLTKINEALCNPYNHKYISYIIYVKRPETLHKHLVEAHPNKLTEEELNFTNLETISL